MTPFGIPHYTLASEKVCIGNSARMYHWVLSSTKDMLYPRAPPFSSTLVSWICCRISPSSLPGSGGIFHDPGMLNFPNVLVPAELSKLQTFTMTQRVLFRTDICWPKMGRSQASTAATCDQISLSVLVAWVPQGYILFYYFTIFLENLPWYSCGSTHNSMFCPDTAMWLTDPFRTSTLWTSFGHSTSIKTSTQTEILSRWIQWIIFRLVHYILCSRKG